MSSIESRRRLALAALAAFALSACGGGIDGAAADDETVAEAASADSPAADDDHAEALAASTAPGGLYVGYYGENPLTNPEDPMIGSLFLKLPKGNAAFAGSMFFTYVGCQSSNVGKISGSKKGLALKGSWAGTLDGSAQSGPYTGSFSTKTQSYRGTYKVDGGKQFQDLRPCIEYYIGPDGSWELFPVGTSVPSTFKLTVKGRKVSWTSPGKPALLLTGVIDEAKANSGKATAVLAQVVSARPVKQSFDLTQVPGLVAGRRYIVTATAVDDNGKRIAFASVSVVR